jgi:YesN/AraC family two-component response regulator
MNDKIEEIKNFSEGINLLYVEDNVGLAENMEKLLRRMFDNIIIAHDGKDGLKEYFKSRPKIVITDINMPNMNGFQMIKKIRALELEAKIIVISAHDEKKHLHTAINLGVFRYLHKPAKILDLVEAIFDTVMFIQREEDNRIFFNQLHTIFDNQNNIIAMMNKDTFTLTNQRFYEFFGVESLEDFISKNNNLDKLLLEHKDFLYSTSSSVWYKTAVENPGKLFHTKIQNHKGQKRHLILKLREIPEKEDNYILSFDDVTELNLMALFDLDSAKSDATLDSKMSVMTLLKVIKDNSSKVKIHNFYKGLTIVNPAVITEISDEDVTLKTVNAQIKIVQISQFMTLSSEVFPKNVICKSIKNIDSDNQAIVIDEMSFTSKSVLDREYIRLQSGPEHSCSLFFKKIKLHGESKIVDISEVSVKVAIDSLPAAIIVNSKVKVSINLKTQGRAIIFTVEATVFRIEKEKRNYNLILLYELNAEYKEEIKRYLANRQMELIREFKSIDVNSST